MNAILQVIGSVTTLLLLTALPLSAGDTVVTVNGPLRVADTQLVNQHGRPIQLRGMSSHGIHWFPHFTARESIEETKKWGANVFRLAMYADSNLGGYNHSPEAAEHNKALLFEGLENALAAGLYVIVDWHILEDRTPLPTMEQAIAFFQEVTGKYPDHPAILYEIVNEPNNGTSWADVRTYAEQVIPAIRKQSPNSVILVGTPEYSSDLAPVMAAPLTGDNIMYTYHFYTGRSNNDFRSKLDAMREAGLPVFVSEWGLGVNKETGELDVEQGKEFLHYLNEHTISWMNWSLANKDEPFSALKPGVTKLSGWEESDLTPSGLLIYRALGNRNQSH